MLLGTKLNKVPSNEAELNKLLQDIYLKTKENYESDIKSNFTGILEIIASEANIITSIHKIKANKGYKGTSIIMYVFNGSLSPNIHFILYVRTFQEFIYPRNYLSKTYKIIPFSNVHFRIMYVFQKSVQNASFPCG